MDDDSQCHAFLDKMLKGPWDGTTRDDLETLGQLVGVLPALNGSEHRVWGRDMQRFYDLVADGSFSSLSAKAAVITKSVVSNPRIFDPELVRSSKMMEHVAGSELGSSMVSQNKEAIPGEVFERSAFDYRDGKGGLIPHKLGPILQPKIMAYTLTRKRREIVDPENIPLDFEYYDGFLGPSAEAYEWLQTVPHEIVDDQEHRMDVIFTSERDETLFKLFFVN